MTFADLSMLFRHFQFKVLIVNLYNLLDFLLHTCLFTINTLQKQNTTISRSQIKYKQLTQNKTKNFKLKSALRAHIFTKSLKIVHNALDKIIYIACIPSQETAPFSFLLAALCAAQRASI